MATKIKYFMAVMLASSISLLADAAPVSPEVACQEAQQFLKTDFGIQRRGKAQKLQAQLPVYTAKENGRNLYYVFNSDAGFVIVSADDRLPAVLGYSENGAFDYQRIPDNMKDWLKGYEGEISHFILTSRDEGGSVDRLNVQHRVKRNAIEPLVKTKWDQTSPYNLLCPTDNQGRLCVTGCVATAYAQIMRYHEWPRTPTGSSDGVDFDGTVYNWRQMLYEYNDGDYTAAQAQSVATLMRQCGAGVNMQYSAWASGAYSYEVQYAMPVYFKYSPDLEMMWKDYTPQKVWSQKIYDELAAGRPVFYSGSSTQGGHAFVCDGYSENEYFHFNWGWGGYEDGYFLLTALNPASGGAGSYEEGYTSHQSIIIGIKPGTESATPTQTALLSSGGFVYKGSNTYGIENDPDGNNIIYNPIGYEQVVIVGLKIEAADGRDFTPVYVPCGAELKIPSNYGIRSMTTGNLPSLADGEYNLTPVYHQHGKTEWQPIMIPIGQQNFVRLTVAGGTKNYSNLGPDKASQSHLLFGVPEVSENVYGNAGVAMRIPVVNVGEGDFASEIGFSISQMHTDTPDMSSVMATYSIPAQTSQNLDIVFTDVISPGEYQLEIMNMDGEVYSDKFTIDVKDVDFTYSNDGMEVTNLSPNFMTSDVASPLYFTIKNTSIVSDEISFTFSVYDAKTVEKIKTVPTLLSLTVPGGYDGRVNVRPIDLELTPGDYLYCISDESGTPLSMLAPLLVQSSIKESNGIAYVETSRDNKEAVVVAPEGDAYTGTLTVPSQIAGLNVKGIRNNTFTFATTSTVELPEAITAIAPGTFYCDNALRNLIVNTTEIIPLESDVFNSSNFDNIWINAPQSIINKWMNYEGWVQLNAPAWTFESNGVEIEGLEMNSETHTAFTPYYMNYLTPLKLRLIEPGGKNVEVNIELSGATTTTVVDPEGRMLELPPLGLCGRGKVTLTPTTAQDGVAEMFADGKPKSVYSIDGRIIMRNADKEMILALKPGLYIIGGKKYIVR